jgi:steroid delta-isomerase
MTESATVRATETVETYALALTESRVDEVVALFAEDAELRDPFDGPIIQGRDAIAEFFAAGVAMIDSLRVVGPVRVTADGKSAAAPMFAEVNIDGTPLEMDTVDVMFFDDAGLIVAMHAFYGPDNVRPRGVWAR